MQLRQLQHFLAAVDCGSITQAASEQNVTQPTLTRSIRKLEQSLRIELLDRSRTGVTPTRYGEAFAEHARVIVTGAIHASNDIGAMRDGRLGHVRLGFGGSALQEPIARALVRLTLEREDLTLSIDYDVLDMQLAKLRRGELDAVVNMQRPGMDTTNIDSKKIANVAIVAVVRPQHPLANRRGVTLAELAAMPWATPMPGDEMHYRQLLGITDGPDNIRIRCLSPAMLRMIAREGDYLILTTTAEIERELREGELVEVDSELPMMERDLCVFTRRQAYMTGALRFVLRHIQMEFAAPPKQSAKPASKQKAMDKASSVTLAL